MQHKTDFNGDGLSDFIRQEKGTWVDGVRDAEVYLSRGNGTFNAGLALTDASAVNGNFVNLIAGDYNGDGLSDFIRQEKGAWVDGVRDAEVYLSRGNGTFNAGLALTDASAVNGNFVNLIAGDYNGDGFSDFIRQEKGAWVDGVRDAEVYLSRGNGIFNSGIALTDASAVNGDFVNLIAGDYNGDGLSDFIRQEKGAWVDGVRDAEVYLSKGNGTFNAGLALTDASAVNGNFVNLIAGDYNGDGFSDFIRQEKGAWVDGVRDAEVYLSRGNGIFNSGIALTDASAVNGDFVNLIAGDYNGDGLSDFIRQEKGAWVDGVRDAEVYLSKGNGIFNSGIALTDASAVNGNFVNLV
ncbi:FG-GAP-like repeat-containing protein [Nostoc favosum]|uniref:FG-GAP-like repeat-containing protein n=1 Tax=Nostoc favosum CHAB5714 TaxID=2780399 RepID=A0ABS8ICA8_9NOSO|nr:FG-GAP-like repeat-containing protein [Nostoc favosum]MCC5601501.1 FG-GAP-like repeat-containing protein [Nostoc favosum CHAB5714]